MEKLNNLFGFGKKEKAKGKIQKEDISVADFDNRVNEVVKKLEAKGYEARYEKGKFSLTCEPRVPFSKGYKGNFSLSRRSLDTIEWLERRADELPKAEREVYEYAKSEAYGKIQTTQGYKRRSIGVHKDGVDKN